MNQTLNTFYQESDLRSKQLGNQTAIQFSEVNALFWKKVDICVFGNLRTDQLKYSFT